MGRLFDDQTVIITGASSGFGKEAANQFAREGARLVLIARRKERLEALAHTLSISHGTRAHILPLDVGDLTSVKEAFNQIPSEFSIPDILINNAGLVRGMGKLWEIVPEEWNEMIDTNLKGLLNVTHQALPSMLRANRGHIINVGSTSGHGTYPGGGVYCATKFAIRALTDTLRMELVASPIRVSLISPGMAKTEFSLVRYYGNQNKAEQTYDGMHPLTASDIAEAILFIASRPPHVNISDMIIYPKNQASPTIIHRQVDEGIS